MLGLIISLIVVVTIIVGLIVHRGINKTKSHIYSLSNDYNLKDIDITDIDKMEDGSGFEMYLYRLFIELGYTGVYKTIGSRDFGADVVFTDREGVRNVVQAKRYSIDNPVGISAVQEVFSCMRYYKAKKAIVIASAKFTEPCETLAGINHVKLLDRDDLISIIEAFKREDIQAVKDRIEAEPRTILESWRETTSPVLHEIKKDYKAEKFVKKFVSK
ncbi:restriction endonuclease [Paenibacillus macquariensis]|uniref:Restriction system protein n=1 Tax=Paenibacillus macquariensis TaxID=948756 RepID=A0ABY1JK89_9BACL|nr:restriction endonuclease [Paenibacillus macquariensis]MEC0089877.1 restriction endonuclease [Paenibacillus macquariensis]SIQ33326.1 restriction system protein [Paenibacillus macquariensis]